LLPTGVALRDIREQLFEAAQRVLVRDGPNALTSRSLTTEAGVAKGVLHRHFADFDDFLVGLAQRELARIADRGELLWAAAGIGTVATNITSALTDLFGPVLIGLVGLVIARDELRSRLRAAGSVGLPVASEAAGIVASYLGAERVLGRIPADVDIDTLAAMLVGAAHLFASGRDGLPLDDDLIARCASCLLT
jgi:AcrR family transcriptional regulator